MDSWCKKLVYWSHDFCIQFYETARLAAATWSTFARKHSIHFKIVLLIYYGLERLEISWYYYQNEKSTKLLTHELLPFIHTNQMRTIKIIIIIITIKDPENSIFFIFFGESASNTQTLQCHMQALHSKALHNHAVVLLSLCSGVILL